MPRPADLVLDELVELVAQRLEQRQEAPLERLSPDTVAVKWTDRLAATLRQIRARRLAASGGHVVGDCPES